MTNDDGCWTSFAVYFYLPGNGRLLTLCEVMVHGEEVKSGEMDGKNYARMCGPEKNLACPASQSGEELLRCLVELLLRIFSHSFLTRKT